MNPIYTHSSLGCPRKDFFCKTEIALEMFGHEAQLSSAEMYGYLTG